MPGQFDALLPVLPHAGRRAPSAVAGTTGIPHDSVPGKPRHGAAHRSSPSGASGHRTAHSPSRSVLHRERMRSVRYCRESRPKQTRQPSRPSRRDVMFMSAAPRGPAGIPSTTRRKHGRHGRRARQATARPPGGSIFELRHGPLGILVAPIEFNLHRGGCRDELLIYARLHLRLRAPGCGEAPAARRLLVFRPYGAMLLVADDDPELRTSDVLHGV